MSAAVAGTIEERLTEAARLHEAGDLGGAWALYEDILAGAPDNADAMHLSGLILLTRGEAEAGLARVRGALERDPDLTDARRNLGLALAGLGRHAQAAEAFRHAARQRPEDPDLLRQLANALHADGRGEEARSLLEEAAAVSPENADLRLALAALHERAGRRGEAIAQLREVTFLRPDRADGYLLLGQMQRAEGQADDAIANLRAARGLARDHAHAAYALAEALHQERRDDEALPHAAAARALAQEDVNAWLLETAILRDLRRPADAVTQAEAALRHHPEAPALHAARGLALLAANRPEEALAALEHANALAPRDVATLVNLAAALNQAGESLRALALYDQAEALDPAMAAVRLNRSMTRLALGDYAGGWRDYEARLETQHKSERRRDITAPRLRPGDEVAGRTVLVHTEQGFGDNLQFVRFVPMLAQRGARVVLEAPPGLGRLLGSVGGAALVIEQGTKLPAHDLAVSVMSLPWVLGVGAEDLPGPVPYLAPPPEVQARWDTLIGKVFTQRPCVGIAWSGNPRFAGFASRSVPFALFGRLREARPDAKFVILQTQYDEATAAAIEKADNFVVARSAIGDFADTAALINRLDLVIASDTSVVHLAGALGRPAWVLLQHGADWRWQRGRADSAWYPSLRLFRQMLPGDWDGVVREAAAALREARFEI